MAFQHSKSSTFTFNSVLLAGLDSVQFDNAADPVDVTGIGDISKSHIAGLGDRNISLSGVTDTTVGAAANTLQLAFEDGTAKAFVYSPNGVTGTNGSVLYSGSGIVSQYDESHSVSDKVTWSAEILITTAVTRTVDAT